jgi:PPK2 family polyphosphate:nucleotide phosphotransferase
VSSERLDLSHIDPGGTPGFDRGKKAGVRALERLAGPVGSWQERLYAEAHGGGTRRLLLVAQGMDTSGKGGVMRHCVGLLDPQGVQITAFKAPTEEERAHDFLWRIEPHVPPAGMIGIFDRSHYEDVLIARVHGLASPKEIERRYDAINAFEHRLADDGVTVVKCFLHVSRDEQRKRLLARLDDPTKHWKFNPGDIDERRLWPDYQQAYEIALERCSTATAPWFLVPADHKWYRNWAITRLLLEHLEAMDPQWPIGTFDVDVQKARLADS